MAAIFDMGTAQAGYLDAFFNCRCVPFNPVIIFKVCEIYF